MASWYEKYIGCIIWVSSFKFTGTDKQRSNAFLILESQQAISKIDEAWGISEIKVVSYTHLEEEEV